MTKQTNQTPMRRLIAIDPRNMTVTEHFYDPAGAQDFYKSMVESNGLSGLHVAKFSDDEGHILLAKDDAGDGFHTPRFGTFRTPGMFFGTALFVGAKLPDGSYAEPTDKADVAKLRKGMVFARLTDDNKVLVAYSKEFTVAPMFGLIAAVNGYVPYDGALPEGWSADNHAIFYSPRWTQEVAMELAADTSGSTKVPGSPSIM